MESLTSSVMAEDLQTHSSALQPIKSAKKKTRVTMGSATKTLTHGSTLQQIKSAKKRAGWQGDPQRRVHELSQKNGDYLFVKFKKIQNEGWEDTPGALANPSQKICTETQFTAMPTKARQLMNFEKGESRWAAVARVLNVLDRKCWLCDLGLFLSPFPFCSNLMKIMQHGMRICQELWADCAPPSTVFSTNIEWLQS